MPILFRHPSTLSLRNTRAIHLLTLFVTLNLGACTAFEPAVGDGGNKTSYEWSIGIFEGSQPHTIQDGIDRVNPVLTSLDVTDRSANSVADPFLLVEDDQWHLFFEVINDGTNKGEIGYAQSDDGVTFHYDRIVLSEPFHLSYPYVFKWDGSYYMVPESRQVRSIRLYRATNFPYGWELQKELVHGSYADSSLLHYGDRWWLFTCRVPYALHLFSAATLDGKWVEHPSSPLYWYNRTAARPGGRIIESDGKLFRFAQDANGGYGSRVRAYQIDKLSPSKFKEHEIIESPVLSPAGSGWRSHRMHTLSAVQLSSGKWAAAVDGSGPAVRTAHKQLSHVVATAQ